MGATVFERDARPTRRGRRACATRGPRPRRGRRAGAAPRAPRCRPGRRPAARRSPTCRPPRISRPSTERHRLQFRRAHRIAPRGPSNVPAARLAVSTSCPPDRTSGRRGRQSWRSNRSLQGRSPIGAPRGLDDVGEQHGREHSVGHGLRPDAGEELLDLVEHEPSGSWVPHGDDRRPVNSIEAGAGDLMGGSRPPRPGSSDRAPVEHHVGTRETGGKGARVGSAYAPERQRGPGARGRPLSRATSAAPLVDVESGMTDQTGEPGPGRPQRRRVPPAFGSGCRRPTDSRDRRKDEGGVEHQGVRPVPGGSRRRGWPSPHLPSKPNSDACSNPAASITARGRPCVGRGGQRAARGRRARCRACRRGSAGRSPPAVRRGVRRGGSSHTELDVRREAGDEDEVERAVAEGLIRDIDVAALGRTGLAVARPRRPE